MQCPNCGFENIPGREVCAICSSELTKSPKRESVMPPRAKDSQIGDRIRWKLSRNKTISDAVSRGHIASIELGDRVTQTAARFRWLTGRNILLLLISPVPGFGFLFGNGNRRTGQRHLLAALGMLILALLLYKTFLADLLVFSTLVLSFFSIYTAADSIASESGSASSRSSISLGITLMTVAAVLLVVSVVGLIPQIGASVIRIYGQPPANVVNINDRVLALHRTGYNKGDVVFESNGYRRDVLLPVRFIARRRWQGIIRAVPGDRVDFTPEGVYINNVLTFVSRNQSGDTGSPYPYHGSILVDNQYLVEEYTVNRNFAGILDQRPGVMVVSGDRIRSAAVAVVWPPSHRRIIRNTIR